MPKVIEQRRIFSDVMESFYRNELRHSSSGELITDEKVARAIAAKISGISRDSPKRRRAVR